MYFVVNSIEWNFDSYSISSIESLIEKFVEFVHLANESGEKIKINDDFQTMEMFHGRILCELFEGDADDKLSGELRQEIFAWLSRVEYYLDDPEWPPGVDILEVTVGDGPRSINADVAWVHHSLRAKNPLACVTLFTPSRLQTSSQYGITDIHFINNFDSKRDFWQDMIIVCGDSISSLKRFSNKAYPNIYFYGDVIDQLENLKGGYLSFHRKVLKIFHALDKFGYWAFTAPPPALSPSEQESLLHGNDPSADIIEKRLNGLGVDASPEKPNVRNSSKCREAREVKLEDEILYCEWHIKIERHQNRIHIHRPIKLTDDKIIVAIISEHLPLP
jgi:hypothetical protein